MAKETLLIIDYGSGNLRSAAKSFEFIVREQEHNCTISISNNPTDIIKADRLVLPGQGAFGDCMSNLQNNPGMIEAIEQRVLKEARPFLGICVGMQLMATRSLEHGVHTGLNWIEGEVVPLKPNKANLKIPHMGWNSLHFADKEKTQDNRHFVLRSTSSSENYYFVHSFMFQCTYNHHCIAFTNYGGVVPAVVGRDNMIGMQFHPEKSHNAGLRLLSDFLGWKP